jgi:nickel-dependent lactate racemase
VVFANQLSLLQSCSGVARSALSALLMRFPKEKTLRTDAWHTGQPLELNFPNHWDVKVLWPPTLPALTDEQIADRLDRPAGRPLIPEMCHGISRPLVIVDDLNRPTPAARVLPLLLERFREAGIAASQVTILIASGTHGAPQPCSIEKKVGPETFSGCRVLIHDAKRNCTRIGRTLSGTPVVVNNAVLNSDFVIGIGGVYPNYTAGFGGGSKLALGVLGFRSIKTLHFRFRGSGWGREKNQALRTELDEIARMIRLNTIISLHLSADCEIVRATCGNHFLYYDDEVAFARKFFSAPIPDGADVVISNAYPSDLSLTVVLQKGTAPLQYAAAHASRIVIACCSDGVGKHGLFPVIKPPGFAAVQFVRRLSVIEPHEFVQAIARRLRRRSPARSTESRNPILLYRPLKHLEDLPKNIPGFRVLDSWSDVLAAIEREQGAGKRLKVFLYPCAPLQSLTQ